ncbi:hypothetical protein [Nicoliella lavandulae]|uniref:Uncharacterized protein n=1 Tax=Nicoliella lavandulae TaxID=3082954 RepID=A0ABU8SJ07_9LACO
MLFIIQPDKKIENDQPKITKQQKILQILYYLIAIWIIPSYLEFLHVNGLHLPIITIVLVGLSLIFAIVHYQHLITSDNNYNYRFLFTWLTMFIFNTTVQFLSNTLISSFMNLDQTFELGYVFGLLCFILVLSYAMSILIFFEPNHFTLD